MADTFKACSIEGCNRSADRSQGGRGGICRAHLHKKRRYGDPHAGRKPKQPYCSVRDCGGKTYSKGFCIKHYQRFKTHGADVVVRKASPAYDWLQEHKRYSSDECLIWPFHRMANGYGQASLGGKRMSASRAMCILVNGAPTDESLEAAHSCGKGNQGCVNPKHLRWATASENQRDRELHGTSNAGDRHWTKRRKVNGNSELA